MTALALFLFPPNWSACVSGPHLSLPLIASALRGRPWHVETWDLSERFYREFGRVPSPQALRAACELENIWKLDRMYFAWEDSFARLAKSQGFTFGLLSGFSGSVFGAPNLGELLQRLRSGTPYTEYYDKEIVPELSARDPRIIGITVSSGHQLAPSIELLLKIRQGLPKTRLVLGGNVITRLRDCGVLKGLSELVDHIVIFQGERAIRSICDACSFGGRGIATGSNLLGDQRLPPHEWPVPLFDGLPVGNYPGTNVVPFVSSRGCYWGKCSFCAIPAGWAETGYGGAIPVTMIAQHLEQVVRETRIHRIKFVDESFRPSIIPALAAEVRARGLEVCWEAYARLEERWACEELLLEARAAGLRRLYFGVELVDPQGRSPFGKGDANNLFSILKACKKAGILVHLFCMVGHPGTTKEVAHQTVDFLVDHQDVVDTADLVGFQLQRGTVVEGVRPITRGNDDLRLFLDFEPTKQGVMSQKEVIALERDCHEDLWERAPRLIHPLYRLGKPWGDPEARGLGKVGAVEDACSVHS